jgi:sporulation protein YlmC with PRC-barrel domain
MRFGLVAGAMALLWLVVPMAADAQQGSPPAAASPQATPPAGNPKLEVTKVTAANGHRASKVIGSSVYNQQNQQIGNVDDLILSDQDKVAFVIVSVGGFLGMGGKLVAIPYDNIQGKGTTKLIIPDASADQLKAMPTFTYTN